jgi:hypothetical protein
MLRGLFVTLLSLFVPSPIITGLLTFLLLEFAFTADSMSAQDKLNLEQALRIAAENHEQAIRQEARLAKDRLILEQQLRAGAEEREQAIRQEARLTEESVRKAMKDLAESRKAMEDLYKSIDDSVGQAQEDLEKRVAELTAENAQLRVEKAKPEKLQKSNGLILEFPEKGQLVSFRALEQDYFDQERKELLLQVLRDTNNFHEDSRRHHILQDILNHNAVTQSRKDMLEKKLKNLFRGYRRMTTEIENALKSIGGEIIADKNHYKIRFYDDNRYIMTIAKTPSDHRAGENIVRDIRNLLY